MPLQFILEAFSFNIFTILSSTKSTPLLSSFLILIFPGLNKFLNEILENLGRVRDLIQQDADTKFVQKEMEKVRDFYTRSMLLFRRKYKREFVE